MKKDRPSQDKAQTLAKDLVTLVVKFARDNDVTVTGQGVIEPVEPVLIVAYVAYPNGDYCLWFEENMHRTLIALVNEKREIAVYGPKDAKHFNMHLKNLQKKLGKK